VEGLPLIIVIYPPTTLPGKFDIREGPRRCVTLCSDKAPIWKLVKTQTRGSRDKPRTHASFIPIATSKHTARNFIFCHLTNMDTTPTHINVKEESSTSPGESIRLRLPPISENCLSGDDSRNSNSDSQSKFESWRNHTWNSEGLNSESPIKDYLLDQDIRSVTLPQPRKLAVSRRVPYKDITNDRVNQLSRVGDIGQIRPAQLSTTVAGTDRVLEAISKTLTQFGESSKIEAHNDLVSDEVAETPATVVDIGLDEGEAQSILSSSGAADPLTELEEAGELGLPRIFSTRSHWTSIKTRILIAETCGEPNNTKCPTCGRSFTSHRRLRIHVQQHYVNSFCLCGEFSFQRDYVLKHQRIARCHTGRIFDVDADNYPEFRDLIIPHISDPKRRELLSQRVPCLPAHQPDSTARRPSKLWVTTHQASAGSGNSSRSHCRRESLGLPGDSRTRREHRRQGTQRPRSTTPYTTGRTHRGSLGNLEDIYRSLDRISEEVERLRRRLRDLAQSAQHYYIYIFLLTYYPLKFYFILLVCLDYFLFFYIFYVYLYQKEGVLSDGEECVVKLCIL